MYINLYYITVTYCFYQNNLLLELLFYSKRNCLLKLYSIFSVSGRRGAVTIQIRLSFTGRNPKTCRADRVHEDRQHESEQPASEAEAKQPFPGEAASVVSIPNFVFEARLRRGIIRGQNRKGLTIAPSIPIQGDHPIVPNTKFQLTNT